MLPMRLPPHVEKLHQYDIQYDIHRIGGYYLTHCQSEMVIQDGKLRYDEIEGDEGGGSDDKKGVP